MKYKKNNSQRRHATITVDPKTKKKLFVLMAKSGYSEWMTFMKKVTYVLLKFKPELKEKNN